MTPRVAIITPVFNPPLQVLEEMLASVRAQTSPAWEHWLVDDRSSRPGVRDALERAASLDDRVHVVHRARQGGISAATNEGIDGSTAEFVGFLDHDDELDPRAIEVMISYLDQHPNADVLYSDEDKIDVTGRRSDVFIKPGWSPERMLGQMYTGHFCVIRRSLIEEVGGLRGEFDGAQDWDLLLRVSTLAREIVHVPEVLYHWRILEGSSAGSVDAKPWAHLASQRAVAEHVARLGIEAEVCDVPDYPGHYWLRPRLAEQPLVSVVIPTGGRTQCIDGFETPLVVNCVRSLLLRSNYEHLELVVVYDTHVDEAVLDALREVAGARLVLVAYDKPFNFSEKMNVGVAHSTGEQLLLLNDDIEVRPPAWSPAPLGAADPLPTWPVFEGGALQTWIESMLVHSRRSEIGAVGAKLFFPDGLLQHAGVIAINGDVGHCFYGHGGNTCGYWGNLIVPGNYLAVTGACLMTSRTAFDAVGGFDEELPVNFNDVDYCFRLRAAGLRSVLLPHVELLHRESSSRGPAPPKPEEVAALRSRWSRYLYDDPYYDRRFAGGDFCLPRAVVDPLQRARELLAEGGPALVVRRGVRRAISSALGRR